MCFQVSKVYVSIVAFLIVSLVLLMKDIGYRLRAARVVRGYKKAKDFADSFNIAYSTLSQHESGKRAISVDAIFQYADILGLLPEWLLTGRGNPCSPHSHLPNVDNKLINQMVEAELNGDIEAIGLPIIDEKVTLSLVYCKLLRRIIKKSLSIFKELPDVDSGKLSQFIFDLYNQMVGIQDKSDIDKLIELSLHSFMLGYAQKNIAKNDLVAVS